MVDEGNTIAQAKAILKSAHWHFDPDNDTTVYRSGDLRDRRKARHFNPGVYFIVPSGNFDYVKIGCSSDFFQRSKQYFWNFGRTPVVLITYAETSDYKSFEKQLHQFFAPNKVEGEWFVTRPVVLWLQIFARWAERAS